LKYIDFTSLSLTILDLIPTEETANCPSSPSESKKSIQKFNNSGESIIFLFQCKNPFFN
jgi:hypothetical protein